jgi:hypothetical protein
MLYVDFSLSPSEVGLNIGLNFFRLIQFILCLKFVIEFLSDFNNYDYDELSEELSFLRKENDESFNDFAIRFIHVCTRFPLKQIPLINEWFQYLVSLSDKQDQLIFNQYELSTNTQSQDGLKVHDDIEVIKAPHFFSTSFILVDQEQHDILQDTIMAFNISLPIMSFSIEEGTLNSKGDHGQTLQDITIVSEVKEMECEFGNLVVSKTSPHSCEQVQDQLVGDDNIGQTSNESSNYGNFLSHSPFYDEHDLVLENISCSLKEHMMRDDLFIPRRGKKTRIQNAYVPIISRDAFCLLNSSTYYSLYPDIFYLNVVQLCVLDYLVENSCII